MEKIKLFKTNILGFRKKEVEAFLSGLEASHRKECGAIRDSLQETIEKNRVLEEQICRLTAENQKYRMEKAAQKDELAQSVALLSRVRDDFHKLKYDYDTLKYVYDGLQERCAALTAEDQEIKNSILQIPFVQQYILQLKTEIEALRINHGCSGNDDAGKEADRIKKLNQCIDELTERIDAILSQT
ncbi:MAG: hypothetical protein ACLSVG_04830 [Clostridia bacterium]